MTRCSVPLCSDMANHHFPKDAELRKRWLEAIQRVDFVPKGARICRKHFQDSDYVKTTGHTGRAPRHRFLKKNAVPSIFEWNSNSFTRMRLARIKRRKVRKHRICLTRGVHSTCKRSDNVDVHHYHDRRTNNVSCVIEHPVHCSSKYLARAQLVTQGTQTSNTLRLFTTKQLVSDDESVYFYTGLDTYTQFTLLLSTLLPMACEIRYRSSEISHLSIEDQFLMLLIKLRRSKPDFEIGKMFGVNKCDVCNVFITWVSFVCDNWRKISFWPSQHLVSSHLPTVFRGNFSNGVIESSEIPITMESQHNAVKLCFSQYRYRNKLKFLVGCSTEGLTVYSTKLEASAVSVSHNQMKEQSGLLINVDQDIAKTVPVEKLIDMTKTYKILACALNQTYSPLSPKIFCICVMLCRFKEGFVGKNNNL